MKKKKINGYVLTLLPLYAFTLVFVVFPIVMMVLLSFAKRAEPWGFEWTFTTENYLAILEPVYLSTFTESLKLAFISMFFIILIGYPCGYFMAKLSEKWKSRVMLLLMIPFWTSSLMRLYGWIIIFRANGVLDTALMGAGITDTPLKLMYTYPTVVVGMVYTLLPFMIYSVYTSAEKLDFTLVEAARDLGSGMVRAFLTISFKLTLPGLLSGVILTFIPSMGLFFIADILGGNKIVLVGNLIHEQLTVVNNWPFAAALSVVLLLLTTIIILIYRRVANTGSLEGGQL